MYKVLNKSIYGLEVGTLLKVKSAAVVELHGGLPLTFNKGIYECTTTEGEVYFIPESALFNYESNEVSRRGSSSKRANSSDKSSKMDRRLFPGRRHPTALYHRQASLA